MLAASFYHKKTDMQKFVYKYGLAATTQQEVTLPVGAEILSVAVQNDVICLWALVNPKAETEERTFEIFGTGIPITYDMGVDRRFIGTVLIDGGQFVFHVFERIN